MNSIRQSLAANSIYAAPILIRGRPANVIASPGSGGSVNVQYTEDSRGAVEAETATWSDWPSGVVTEKTFDLVIGDITAVRAYAATVAGEFEVIT